MTASSRDSDEITGINITPLVDIVLVLLIIFMVSTRLVMNRTIEIDNPTPLDAEPQIVQTPVMLTLDGAGQLFVDGVRLSRNEAMKQLREAKKKDPALRAIIAADRTLGYGEVVRLIDLVRGEGITRFAVVSAQPRL